MTEVSKEAKQRELEWLRCTWPLLGRFKFKPEEQVVTTIGRVAELLAAFSAEESERLREELVTQTAYAETRYELWQTAEAELSALREELQKLKSGITE